MTSLIHSINFFISVLAFISIIIIPIGVIFVILSIPYWIWEAFEADRQKLPKEYFDDISLFRFLTNPFRFYFCKIFGIPYQLKL